MAERSADGLSQSSTLESVGDVRNSSFSSRLGDSIPADSPISHSGPWELPRWLPAALLTMLAAGAMAPLADPDLPMHLAVGRWIVEHRAVPTVEPFAWTRPGAPYFAYSWLVQTALYLLMHVGGPGALRLLHGGLLAAAFWAALVAGRELGWTRNTS